MIIREREFFILDSFKHHQQILNEDDVILVENLKLCYRFFLIND